MALFGICNPILLYKKPDLSMILNSALLGAYLIVRGISLIIGSELLQMPNEFTIANLLASGAIEHVPWPFYPILLAIILLGAGGSFIQLRHKTSEGFDQVHLYHLL